MISREETVINKIYGKKWNSFTDETKEAVKKLLSWIFDTDIVETEDEENNTLITAIKLACIEVFGISYDCIITTSRKRNLVEKRYMIFCTIMQLSKSSEAKIATLFPLWTRTSVTCHSKTQLRNLCEVDSSTKTTYERFKTATEKYLNSLYNENDNCD